ncbi:hypothetical protein N9164_11630, partial [Draconibacterium sp.]|nr:hypothetical protein [Draconibacterium sp.]
MSHPTANKTISQKIIWHLKVVAGAVIISLIFGFIVQQKFVYEQFISMLVLTFLQLEIFIWLGAWFFQSVKSDSANFIK